jgi:predicted TIM-barrel fold metal-dependent hydrolase
MRSASASDREDFAVPLPFKLVSADSHIVEPPTLWTDHIEPKFRDRAPHLVSREDGDFLVCEGALLVEHGIGLMATKRKYEHPENYDFDFRGRWADVIPAAYDPDERIKELDREGIEAELMYTSLGLGMYMIPDREFRYACFRAFNDWLAEFCAAHPKRLFGIAMIPTDNIERDVAELERCAKMGLRGAMIAIAQESGDIYGEAKFDPLWSAAEDLGMPLSLHTAASETSFHATGNMFADFSCGFTPTMYSITSMIFSGLFDRHPKLKMLSVENDASWALGILERMDDRWTHDQTWADGSKVTSGRLPSQIFHDQVAATFMRDRTAIRNRDIIGYKNIMWGSDYPHFDGAWPKSADALAAQFDGVPLEDQIRIGRTNAIDFYNLPIETKVEAEAAA